MISLLFIILAAGFNAVMDATENENFHESILRNLNQQFWYKRESWKYAKMIGGYRIDAWHLSKSAMIICFAFAVIFYQPVTQWWLEIVLIGGAWNSTFVLTYHKILKVK